MIINITEKMFSLKNVVKVMKHLEFYVDSKTVHFS
jgi:hypothetical protein